MPEISEPLTDKRQTVKRIFWLADKFKNDLDDIYTVIHGKRIPVSSLSLREFYDFVKSLPYKRDVEPVEIVARPSLIIERVLNGFGKDCKKASVLLGAYCNISGIKWRLACISTRPDCQVHHVFNQVYMIGGYHNCDATYPYMSIFEPKYVTKAEYFSC